MKDPVPGTRNAGRRPASFACWVLGTGYCLCLLAGCQGSGRGGFETDPLTNGPPIPRNAPAQASNASAGAAPAAAAAPGALPPLTAPSSTTSQAALTNGANPPLDLNRDMRIGAGAGPAPPPAAPVATAQGGAVLRGPEPVADVGRPQPAAVPVQATSVALAGGARADSYPQLQDALIARGVNWQRLETIGDGEWKFSCSIPNRQNPAIGHHYEARARSDLAAIRAVLDEIDRQRPAGS